MRAASKVFADQVNAKLPVDRPDYILLRLTEAHEGPRLRCGETEDRAARHRPRWCARARSRGEVAKLPCMAMVNARDLALSLSTAAGLSVLRQAQHEFGLWLPCGIAAR